MYKLCKLERFDFQHEGEEIDATDSKDGAYVRYQDVMDTIKATYMEVWRDNTTGSKEA